MKKSNLVVALALFAFGAMFSSCSAGKGCKGGGWYGDRNLTEVTPTLESTEKTEEFYSTAECAD